MLRTATHALLTMAEARLDRAMSPMDRDKAAGLPIDQDRYDRLNREWEEACDARLDVDERNSGARLSRAGCDARPALFGNGLWTQSLAPGCGVCSRRRFRNTSAATARPLSVRNTSVLVG
jgi:hypothetical protein